MLNSQLLVDCSCIFQLFKLINQLTCRIWGCVYFQCVQCVQRFREREHGNNNIFLLLSSLYYFTLTLRHGTGQPAHCAILHWRCGMVRVNQPIVLFYIDVVAWYGSTSPLCYFTLTLWHGTRQSCIYIGLICVSWYPIFMSLIANSQGFSLNYGRVKKSSFYFTTVWVAMKYSFIKRLYIHYIQITLNT